MVVYYECIQLILFINVISEQIPDLCFMTCAWIIEYDKDWCNRDTVLLADV